MTRTYATLVDALNASDTRWERPFLCPVHDDHTASASVNVQKGLWTCHACHAKGVTTAIEYDERMDLAYIDELLDEQRVMSEQWLTLFISGPVHEYWLSRFSEPACRHFQLGTDPATRQPCYPIRLPDGGVLGVVLRNLDPMGSKYKYPSRIKSHDCLFNYHPQEVDTVVLVEGAMDVVACWEAGHEALGIYGSSLSRRQVQLVRSLAPARVVLGFDNDHAGRQCVRQAQEALGDLDTVAVPWQRYERYGHDLAELPLSIRATVLSELAW